MLREVEDLSVYFAEIRRTPVEEITLKRAMETIKSHGEDALRAIPAEMLDNVTDFTLSLASSTIEAGEDCGGMSIDQLAALRMYTTDASEGTSLYSLVNYHLVHTQHLPAFVPYIWLLLQALKKCPVFSGTTVYRGIRLEGQELTRFLSELQVGTRHRWNRLTSTSAIVSVQERFLGETLVEDSCKNILRLKSGVMFHVHLRPGARIVSRFSNFPDEEEILLPPGFQLEVVSTACPNPGLHIIQLKEIDSESPIIDLNDHVRPAEIPRHSWRNASVGSIQADFVSKLHSLKRPDENDHENTPRDGSVRGVLSGCWKLSEAALKQLFTSDSTPVRVRRSYPEGQGVRDVAVVKAADPASESSDHNKDERGLSFHFKSNPEFPFHELAISQLGLMLFGDAVLHDVLEVWMCGRWHVFLVSETVVGDTLAKRLKWGNSSLSESERLDSSLNVCDNIYMKPAALKSFGMNCLMTMLCRLQDQKPDNVLIREDGTLACIDNERAFVVDRYSLWSGKSEVQSVLFCMNCMKTSVHSEIIDIISGWDEDFGVQFVDRWLLRLSELVLHAVSWRSDFSSSIGLMPAIVWKLIVGISQIKRFANSCTYLQLLEILLPETSRSYVAVLSREESIEKRFYAVSEYNASSQSSKLSTMDVMLKVLKEKVGGTQEFQWVAGSHDRIQSPVTLRSLIPHIRDGLMGTALDLLGALNNSLKSGDEIIWWNRLKDLTKALGSMGLLEHVLSKVDYSRGAISHRERQLKFFDELRKLSHNQLTLVNGSHITARTLEQLTFNSSNLVSMTLIRCGSVVQFSNSLQQRLTKLKRLRIEEMMLGEVMDTSILKCLAKLELIKVDGLKKLVLSPASVYLDLTGTWTNRMDVIELGQAVDLKRENLIGVETDYFSIQATRDGVETLQRLPTTHEIEEALRPLDWSQIGGDASGLAELALHLSFHSLYFHKANWITKSSLWRISSNSKYLKELSLKGCDISKDAFLTLVRMPLSFLRILDLSDCPDLEVSVRELHSVAENITSLDLSNTSIASFDVVEQSYFRRDDKLYLPLLKCLSLSRCKSLQRFYVRREYDFLNLENDHHVNTDTNLNVLPALVSLLSIVNIETRRVLVEVLRNLAANNDNKISVVRAGAIPPLVDLLGDENTEVEVRRNAVGALGNLAVNDDNEISIAIAGAIPPLVRLLGDGDTEIRSNAADALRNLAVNDDNKIAIASAGAIPPLVQLLGDGDTVVRRNASGTFRNLAVNDDIKFSIASAGAIPPLVHLLGDDNSDIRGNASGVLWNLAINDDNKISVVRAGAVPLLVRLLGDGDAVVRRNAAGTLRNLAVIADNKLSIASAGAIPPLVDLLGDGDTEVRRNAAGALRNLALNDDNKISIASAGAIPSLVHLLGDGLTKVRRNAAGALRNLSVNNDNKTAVARAGAIPPLVHLLGDGNIEVRRNATGALLNLAVNDGNKITIARARAIPQLMHLLGDGDAVVRRNAAGTLRNLAVIADNKLSIASAGAIPPLVDLLGDEDTEVRENAAGALRHLAVNDDNKISIASAGAIPPLVHLLDDGDTDVRRNATGALRNLAVNDDNQISMVSAGAIPPLVHLLGDINTEVRRNTAGALRNLAVNDGNRISIASAGAIPPLVHLLGDRSTEARGNSAGTLHNLAVNDDNKITIASAGAILPLVHLLDDGNTAVRRNAAGALESLAINDDNKITIFSEGAIPPLVNLLSDVNTAVRGSAAGALGNLAVNANNKISIASVGAIPPLVRLLGDGSTEVRRNAAGALEGLAVNDDNKISIARAGAIPPLVDLLGDGDTEVRRYAAGALTILAVNADNEIAIGTARAIPALVPLLGDGDTEVRRNAASALRILAVNSYRKISIAIAGAIPPLVDLLGDGDTEVRGSAAGALRNLAVSDGNKITIAIAGAIPALVPLLGDGSTDVRRNAVGALRNLAVNDDNQISIVSAGAIPPLMGLLNDRNTEVRQDAADLLWNFDVYNGESKICVVKAGAIPSLVDFLSDEDA